MLSFVLAGPCSSEGTTWYVRPDGMNDTKCATLTATNATNNCKSLLEYAIDVNRYFTNDTVIEFLFGNHSLSSLLVVNVAHNLSLVGRKSTIWCNTNDGGVIFNDSSYIQLRSVIILSCGAKVPKYHLLYSALTFQRVTNIRISNVQVLRSNGFGLNIYSCFGDIMVEESSFQYNKGSTYLGGNARFLYRKCPTSILNTLVIDSSNFTDGKSHNDFMNTSKASGIVVASYCPNNSLMIKLEHIRAENNLGGNIAFILSDSIHGKHWDISIANCSVANGNGKSGAGLYFTSKFNSYEYNKCSGNSRNILRVTQTIFSKNMVTSDGGGFLINIHDSDCTPHRIEVTDSVFHHNSVIYSSGHSSAIKILKVSIPGFYTRTSPINEFHLARTTFFENSVNGSELQASVMEVLNFEKMEISDCNFTDNVGSAISLRASNVIFSGEILFENNTATNGGALKFCESSVMFINSSTTITFKQNRASSTGGAIFSQQSCLDESLPCFFQPNVNTSIKNVQSLETKSHMILEFINNSASIAGDAVYGGDIDNCYTYSKFVRQEGEKSSFFASHEIFDTIFDMTAQNDNSSTIASEPFNVSFCDSGDKIKNLSVIPGREFNVSMVAKGQRNGLVPATINARIDNVLQNTTSIHVDRSLALPKTCSEFNLTLKTKYLTSVILKFEIEHINPQMLRNEYAFIHLSIQKCPWGFQLKDSVCDCTHVLKRYGHSCNLQKLTIVKKSKTTSWIGCQIFKNETSCGGKTVLTAKDCGHLKYCNYSISEFTEETIDSQCVQGRTGVLCGECKKNLSLVLGTSYCKQCSNAYVGLIVVYLAAGVLLIVILTAFNITVTNGTLYGLVFYANFIHANEVILFPHFSRWNVSRILIAWLNLDLGIEVCFYNGLDAYQKTWLQFGYIFYIWSLQVIIICLCRRYVFFTRLFGRNVTKVLSTLILLCFAKALQTIRDTLEFRVLYGFHYETNNVIVTALDGNTVYLSPKHIPQFVFAILLTIVLFIFSLCLIFIKILTTLSDARCFKWVARSLPFFDTFTGPCNQNYVFWPGLLFFIRGGLYLTYLIEFKKIYHLSITGCVAVLIIVLSFLTPKGVYKKWSLNLLELSYNLNLMLTCLFVAFVINNTKHDKELISSVIGHISVSIALISFLVFHFRNCFRKLAVKCCSAPFRVLPVMTKQKKEMQTVITHSEVSIESHAESHGDERDPLLHTSALPSPHAYANFRESLIEDV